MKTFYLLFISVLLIGSSIIWTAWYSAYMISLYIIGFGLCLLIVLRLSKKFRQNAVRKQQERLFQEWMRSHTVRRY